MMVMDGGVASHITKYRFVVLSYHAGGVNDDAMRATERGEVRWLSEAPVEIVKGIRGEVRGPRVLNVFRVRDARMVGCGVVRFGARIGIVV